MPPVILCGRRESRRVAPVTLSRRLSLISTCCLLSFVFLTASGTTIDIVTPMPAPEWARLQRRILADTARR